MRKRKRKTNLFFKEVLIREVTMKDFESEKPYVKHVKDRIRMELIKERVLIPGAYKMLLEKDERLKTNE